MVNLFGKDFYIDFDKITEKCEIKKSDNSTDPEVLELNVFKFELIKMCLQRVLEDGYDDENDLTSLSINGMSFSFKIALYTLIKNEILLEYDEEE